MSSQPDLATLYPDAIVDAAIVAWINHDLQYQHHLRPDMRRALYAADLAQPNTTINNRPPADRRVALLRSPQPVKCTICEWRGYRLNASKRPCPSCDSKVEYR
jgi:hypothetical protein